jgi:hypothetical protein
MSALFVVLWIVLFTILPTWVGVRLSRSHGETPLVGGLLGFFFSWLGVLITWLIVRGKRASGVSTA